MSVIFEYTGGEKKPEVNKVIKKAQKKNYVTADDLNNIASWLNNLSGFVKNLDDTKLDKDKAINEDDIFPAVSGLLLKEQIDDIEDQITDLNKLVNADHTLQLTGDVLGERTFNLSDSTITVDTKINKTVDPTTPSDPPTTPSDPTCNCPDEETIKSWIDEKIQNINTGGGMEVGTIFAYASSNPPEGALPLTGTLITNCDEKYTDFYNWLQDEKGEMIDVPLYKPWTQPALTANGIMGGDSYACTCPGGVYYNYYAYQSFNGSRTDAMFCLQTVANNDLSAERTLTFYSPDKLKISQIELFVNNNQGYCMGEFQIQASSNGTSWTTIYSGTITLPDLNTSVFCVIPKEKQAGSNDGWNYIRLNCIKTINNNVQIYTGFPKVFITAQQYYCTAKASNGHIRIIDNTYYKHEIDEYGFCGAFVIDGNKVTLPDYRNALLTGGDSSNNGTTIPAGLPNISGSVSFREAHGGILHVYNPSGVFLHTHSGQIENPDGGADVAGHLPQVLLFDASHSNPIYGNSDTVQPPAIRVNWCIQAKKITSTPSTPTDPPTVPSTPTNPPTVPSTQEFAHTDLKNVTEPVQAFKNMSMRWGMPDYSAGLDITSYLYKPGDFYTVPYDCIICAKCIYNTGILLYTAPNKGGATIPLKDMKQYLFLAADGQYQGDVGIVSYAYCDANTTLYTDSFWYNTGTIIMYPLKGSKL